MRQFPFSKKITNTNCMHIKPVQKNTSIQKTTHVMLINLLPGYDVSCAGYVGGVGGQVVHVRRADDVVRVRQIEPVRLQKKSF